MTNKQEINRMIGIFAASRDAVALTNCKKEKLQNVGFKAISESPPIYENGFWKSDLKRKTAWIAHYYKSEKSSEPAQVWYGKYTGSRSDGSKFIFRMTEVKGPIKTSRSFKDLFNNQPQGKAVYFRSESSVVKVPDDDISLVDSLEIDFDKQRRQSLEKSIDALRKRIAKSKHQPRHVNVVVSRYVRNPDVVALALKLAKGKCGECRKYMSFNDDESGFPFLEVHHRNPLRSGGLDNEENTVALCPNCHRHAHHKLRQA